MHTPWHNKTGIPKAIAILATTAILAFSLCAVDVTLGLPKSDNGWVDLLRLLPLPFGVTVIVCVIAAGVLFDLNKRRSKNKN